MWVQYAPSSILILKDVPTLILSPPPSPTFPHLPPPSPTPSPTFPIRSFKALAASSLLFALDHKLFGLKAAFPSQVGSAVAAAVAEPKNVSQVREGL